MTATKGPGYWRHVFLEAADQLINHHGLKGYELSDYMVKIELGEVCERCLWDKQDHSLRFPWHQKDSNTWLYACLKCGLRWDCQWEYMTVKKAVKVHRKPAPV